MLRRQMTVAAVAIGLLGSAAGGAAAAEMEGGTANPPVEFEWSSSGVLMSPKPDANENAVSVKDPTVVRYRGDWLVYGTTADTSGDWSLFGTVFDEWSQADSARQYHLEEESGVGTGYRAAPHLFYFAPDKEWYLVYQTGLPSYSTTDDPTDPTSWSKPRNFQNSVPDIVRDNIGNGFWLDYWVICDEEMCYLFSSDDNGHLYRAETTVKEFPNGFANTKIVLSDPNRYRLFEGGSVYKIDGSQKYLLVVEAIGSTGRYFRSWTADSLDGTWTPLADTEKNPFAGSANVVFPDGAWTGEISHGELVRSGIDQTMPIDPGCLQFLYQGRDPASGGDYSQLPYRLGLLTQIKAGRTCTPDSD
jgi:endo-1,4-beta-xylanase